MVRSPPDRHKPTLEVRRIGDNGLAVSIRPPGRSRDLEPANLDLLVAVSVDGGMMLPLAGQPSSARDVLARSGVEDPTAMDVLKRALAAVIDHLTPDDRLGVLCASYSSSGGGKRSSSSARRAPAGAGEGPARLQFMNSGHKAWARQAVAEIGARDGDGDVEGLIGSFRPAFDQTPRVRPVRAVFFFTNRSFPNFAPEKALKKLSTQIKCSHKPFTVHTFGFGPNVDSRMLSDLANAGWGSYTYIPSAGHIPNLLFQAVASQRSTFITFARLQYYHGRDYSSSTRDPDRSSPSAAAPPTSAKCELRPADDFSRDYARYNRGGRTRDVSVGSLLLGSERRLLLLFDPRGATPLPTSIALCYRDNLQESPWDQGNLWETVRLDFESGAAVGRLGWEAAGRAQYPVVKAAVCNTLAHVLGYAPEQKLEEGEEEDEGEVSVREEAFSSVRFEAGVSVLQMQAAEAFPLIFDPLAVDLDGGGILLPGGDAADAALPDAFGLPLAAPLPDPHFHTAQLQSDLAPLPSALLERLRLLVRADESAWRWLARHVLYSRLSVYRNEILCAYEFDARDGGAGDGFGDPALPPVATDPLLPAAPWRATVAALLALFEGPPSPPQVLVAGPSAAGTLAVGGGGGGSGGGSVGGSGIGVDGAARILTRDGASGTVAPLPLADLARWGVSSHGCTGPAEDGDLDPTATDIMPADGAYDVCPTAVAAPPHIMTPAGPRRALAFLAERVDAATTLLARLPSSAEPLLVIPTDGAGEFNFDDLLWYAFPPDPTPADPASPSGPDIGASGRTLIGAAQPVALQGEAFRLAPLDADARLPDPRAEPCPHLWTLLLEPDPNPEAHVALVEGWRVATAGHPLLSGPGSVAGFGGYGGVLLSLPLLEGVPGCGIGAYLVNGVRRDDRGDVVELYSAENDLAL